MKRFSSTYDYVLTSGGIGPTHDDLTFECRFEDSPNFTTTINRSLSKLNTISPSGVAKAFDCDLAVHPELENVCKQWFKTDELSGPALKLAQVSHLSKDFPSSASLFFGFS